MGEIELLAARLTEAQKHFLIMSSDRPIHPYDIDVSGLTAKAMVRRGLAYRTLCRTATTDEAFNGYGLTPLGLRYRAALRARASITRTTGHGDGNG